MAADESAPNTRQPVAVEATPPPAAVDDAPAAVASSTPFAPRQQSAAADSLEASPRCDGDADSATTDTRRLTISASPLVKEPLSAGAAHRQQQSEPTSTERTAAGPTPMAALVPAPIETGEGASPVAFSSLGLSSPSAPPSEPTPRLQSPPRSVHTSKRAGRESILSDPMSTPSLTGSPPKSIGKVLLRRSGAARDVRHSPEPPLFVPAATPRGEHTPELPSPPKSVGRVAQAARHSTTGATAAEWRAALDDVDGEEFYSPEAGAGDSQPREYLLESGARRNKWVVGAATPLSAGHQLRATPGRMARIEAQEADLFSGTPHARKSSARRPRTLPRSAAKREEAAEEGEARAHLRGSGSAGRASLGGSALGHASGGGGAAAAAAIAEAASASPAASPAASAEPTLDLRLFPGTFQQGVAAEQMLALHGALSRADGPLSMAQILAVLPEGKFEQKRVTLLLEVMQSRKAVVGEGYGMDRRWLLPLDA